MASFPANSTLNGIVSSCTEIPQGFAQASSVVAKSCDAAIAAFTQHAANHARFVAMVNAVTGLSLAQVAESMFLLLQLQKFLKRYAIALQQVVTAFALVHAAEALLWR